MWDGFIVYFYLQKIQNEKLYLQNNITNNHNKTKTQPL